MQNHVQQLFEDVRLAHERSGEAPVVFIFARWTRLAWLRDEWRLLASARFSPKGVARFGYRVFKRPAVWASAKARGVRRRLDLGGRRG